MVGDKGCFQEWFHALKSCLHAMASCTFPKPYPQTEDWYCFACSLLCLNLHCLLLSPGAGVRKKPWYCFTRAYWFGTGGKLRGRHAVRGGEGRGGVREVAGSPRRLCQGPTVPLGQSTRAPVHCRIPAKCQAWTQPYPHWPRPAPAPPSALRPPRNRCPPRAACAPSSRRWRGRWRAPRA